MIVYQARSYIGGVDREFTSKDEARAFAEIEAKHRAASFELITWNVYRNLPGAIPEMRYSSCALEVYEPGKGWRGVNIF